MKVKNFFKYFHLSVIVSPRAVRQCHTEEFDSDEWRRPSLQKTTDLGADSARGLTMGMLSFITFEIATQSIGVYAIALSYLGIRHSAAMGVLYAVTVA